MEVKGTPIVITGGGSGMGAATANYLAAAGAKIAILDRAIEAAEKVAKSIDGIAFACDVTDPTSVATSLAAIQKEYGEIRVCISCAGIAVAQRMVGREQAMPLEDFTRVLQINLIGTFNVMRLTAQMMSNLAPLGENLERGVIINTASVAAYEGQIGQVAYSASKAGIVGMTLPAARELAQFGIRVMTIAPGLIDTPMFTGLPDAARESLAATVPFPKRLGKPVEYAMLTKQIIENPLLNGSVIRLDGALRMTPK
ncbi:MAG: SDR family NAD(P)-dependent oxidoreductase [Coxiellaceae bacterium]|nr:MAG: SDR family NAD(P)-dependent oxidoreductase [Coxiellaceae bacterium]